MAVRFALLYTKALQKGQHEESELIGYVRFEAKNVDELFQLARTTPNCYSNHLGNIAHSCRVASELEIAFYPLLRGSKRLRI